MVALLVIGAVLAGLAFVFLMPAAVVVLLFGLAIFSFVFWVWMLVDAIQNKGLEEGEKIAWVLAIVFLHFIGGLLYYIIGRPKRLTPRIGS